MKRADRFRRLDLIMREGRLTRREFRGIRGARKEEFYYDGTRPAVAGKPVECIIAALVPEMQSFRQLELIPEDLMPAWLGCLTPWMTDNGTLDRWFAFTRNYASLLPRCGILTSTDWDRIELRLLRLPLLRLRLISRMPVLVSALKDLDAAVGSAYLGEHKRREVIARMEAVRRTESYHNASIIDRAMLCFAEPDVGLVKKVFNEACKTLPPKARRRPSVVDELSSTALHIIEREVEGKEQRFGVPESLALTEAKVLRGTRS